MSINKVLVSGNLARDAELRATTGGTAVLSFTVAVNDRRKSAQTGEREDVANFVDCVAFGSRAEGLAPRLRKGTKVSLEGKLRYSSWEKDGQKRSKLEVVMDELEFVGPRTDAARARQQPAGGEGGYYGEDASF